MRTEFHVDRNTLIHPPQIMGKSPKITRVFREIKKFAPKDDLRVLISGENGTYKELVAKAIHYNSPRRKGPFVVINMASTPRELAEAELFGHGKDSSTGSAGKKAGKIEEAAGGTLFLDEISEMDAGLQGKFLRFLQDNDRSEQGSSSPSSSGARMIFATSKDLKETVAKKQFGEDLYNALCKVHIKIPPLRERKEDILFLAQYFLEESVEKFETGQKELSKEAKDFLLKYNWPWNMRQLESTIKRAAILSIGKVISKKDLLLEDVGSCSITEFLEEKLKHYLKEMTKLENCKLYDTVLSEVERSLLTIVLKETEGNQLRAARTLGINRNTLRAKIKEYKIRL
jgi:two-component system nitrogen regulation response regulator GlnG